MASQMASENGKQKLLPKIVYKKPPNIAFKMEFKNCVKKRHPKITSKNGVQKLRPETAFKKGHWPSANIR